MKSQHSFLVQEFTAISMLVVLASRVGRYCHIRIFSDSQAELLHLRQLHVVAQPMLSSSASLADRKDAVTLD